MPVSVHRIHYSETANDPRTIRRPVTLSAPRIVFSFRRDLRVGCIRVFLFGARSFWVLASFRGQQTKVRDICLSLKILPFDVGVRRSFGVVLPSFFFVLFVCYRFTVGVERKKKIEERQHIHWRKINNHDENTQKVDGKRAVISVLLSVRPTQPDCVLVDHWQRGRIGRRAVTKWTRVGVRKSVFRVRRTTLLCPPSAHKAS